MTGQVDKQIHNEVLNIEIEHLEVGYFVRAINTSASNALAVRVNFGDSRNLRMSLLSKDDVKPIGGLDTGMLEFVLKPRSRLNICTLDPISPKEPYSYKYEATLTFKDRACSEARGRCLSPQSGFTDSRPAVAGRSATSTTASKTEAAPRGPKVPTNAICERSELIEGLDLLTYKYKNHGGYNLMLENVGKTGQKGANNHTSYFVGMDLSDCQNLRIVPEGNATLVGKTVTVTVGPQELVNLCDLPVINKYASYGLSYDAQIKGRTETMPDTSPRRMQGRRISEVRPSLPMPAGCNSMERNSLNDQLDILVFTRDEGGYCMMVENKDYTNKYILTVDFNGSHNLILVPEGQTELINDITAKLTVRPREVVRFVNMPPKSKFDGYGMRYSASAVSRRA